MYPLMGCGLCRGMCLRTENSAADYRFESLNTKGQKGLALSIKGRAIHLLEEIIMWIPCRGLPAEQAEPTLFNIDKMATAFPPCCKRKSEGEDGIYSGFILCVEDKSCAPWELQGR